MIRYKKARKKDLPLLIEYKLLTINPYLKEDKDKLKTIADVSKFIKENYNKGIIIYHNFKAIGCYIIIDKELNTLYIKDAYQNKLIGSKILKKEKNNIDKIKVKKENKCAINFYKKKGFTKEANHDGYIILRKAEQYENE